MSTWDLETPALLWFHNKHQRVTHEGCRHERNDHAAQDDQGPEQESGFTKAIGQRQQG